MAFCTLTRGVLFTLSFIVALGLGIGNVSAMDERSELKDLKKDIEELRNELHRTTAEKQKRIEELEHQLQILQSRSTVSRSTGGEEPKSGESALDKALSNLGQYQDQGRKDAIASHQIGGATLKLMDISLDILASGGTSTERDGSIEILQGGEHDPKRRGFTLNQAEIGLQGAVDPYLTGEAFFIFSEEHVEMEEAFFKTTSLPLDLQLKGGYFFTEFGIINQTHPHAWDWIDMPIINTRLFGGEQTRGSGARLSCLTPLPWFSEVSFGMQNANSDTEVSFRGAREDNGDVVDPGLPTTIGGRPLVEGDTRNLGDLLYLARWENSFDLSSEVTTKFGFSGLFGPNDTGSDGHTRIYGADLKVKWRPASTQSGWPFLLWQSEIMARDYKADSFFFDDGTTTIDLPKETLHDWGFYTQLLYGFRPHWAVGLRGEYTTGSEDSVLAFNSREEDPFRDNRYRISPLLAWYPSEFSRFRLQYNYDHAEHLSEDAHSVWLSAEILFGAHPAHKY